MAKEKKDKHFIKKPVYEGGLSAMRAFIKKNLQYPPQAIKNNIEGTVYIKYTLNYKAEVISCKVIRSLGYGCDKEAERLVRLLKFKAPKNRGLKVKFHKNIQIHFRLDQQKNVQKTPTIQYNYTSTKSTPQQAENPKSYTFSIKL